MKARRLLPSLLVLALLGGLVAAGPAAAVSKRERTQNKAIKKLNKRTTSAGKKLDQVAADLGKAAAELTSTKDGLAAIQAAVPTVIGSLTTLADAATQLKAGLELLGGSFTTYVSGAEYGVVQLYVDGVPQPGQILVSSDIPDDLNQATLTGKLIASIPNGTAAAPITLKAAIRSGEKDGTGAADPAGAAGLMAMTAEVIGAPGTTSIGGGNPGAPSTLPLTSKPNAALGGFPVYPIDNKAPRVDETPNPLVFPDAVSIDLTDPATLQTLTAPPGKFTVTNTSGTPAALIVNVTVRFHDLTPSSTDLGA